MQSLFIFFFPLVIPIIISAITLKGAKKEVVAKNGNIRNFKYGFYFLFASAFFEFANVAAYWFYVDYYEIYTWGLEILFVIPASIISMILTGFVLRKKLNRLTAPEAPADFWMSATWFIIIASILILPILFNYLAIEMGWS